MMNTNNTETTTAIIPLYKKYGLSIVEASQYTGVGQNTLRAMIKENPNVDFVIWIGSRALIKRRKLEEYLDRVNTI